MSREFFSEIGDALYIKHEYSRIFGGNTVLTTKRKRLPYLVLYSQDVMGFYITLSKRILKQICEKKRGTRQRGKLTKKIYYVPKYKILTHLCHVMCGLVSDLYNFPHVRSCSSNKEIFWLFIPSVE